MKKLLVLITGALIICATTVCYAIIPQPASIALNASTYVAIEVPETPGHCRDIAVVTSDSSAWLLSYDQAGTTPVTIPAPGSLSITCVTGKTLFYAKSSAGTPTLTLIYNKSR